MLKLILVFIFGPNLKTLLRPRPKMNNIKAGLFYSRIFAQSERVLCCLALQKQVLIASNNSIEGLELHSFMFSEHLKLKMSGNVIEQLGILLYLFYLHINKKKLF